MSDDKILEIDPNTTSEKEGHQLEGVKIQREKDNNDSRNALKDQAVGIVQTWVGFIIVITIAQMILPSIGLGLQPEEFIAVVTTTTASIIGIWIVIGKGLFN